MSKEDWDGWKEWSAEKRRSNKERSTAILTEAGIAFKSFNDGVHLRIETRNGGIVNFYPSTGLYEGALSGRGVFNLIKALEEVKNG